jgi:hypothetical protein
LPGGLLIGVVAWSALAAEQPKDNRTELGSAQRQLRGPDEMERAAGIRRLGTMLGAEAAKIIVAIGLVESASVVRRMDMDRL